MKISIRNAEKDDIEGIMSIEHESFHTNIAENSDTFLERIETFSHGFLIIVIEGEIAGYISSELWDYSENIDTGKFVLGHSIAETHRNDGKELYISSIAVLKKYRGKGYGNALFSELEKHITCKYEIASIILIVSENWHAAKSIYEKNGFRQVHVISGFFDDENNSDAIVMRKNRSN
ncbi:ribosomal-protein-alanine N-acetyltransferase [Methanolobus vulcani]|uniref:Ribosomal-protein-alanine N-acetyltransferase n=1 Tax=Methanolobus vulcani TaxID=38026 RepID=A0A7Z7B0J2_9EURY|nr:N-acetyltransferase [Methanolobus vulcani]MDK2824923.1 [ribosomal protein S18]-alanine N-acetyltransferase [Methanolobus sp.]MDK2947226.1 [ribosomal protein S18]-alanine N-acetyltransferase [Methanolobus sp.]SDG11815.1 ribosomal-protein-alanine N-acetyltransferase [Methanolobus vulcani]